MPCESVRFIQDLVDAFYEFPASSGSCLSWVTLGFAPSHLVRFMTAPAGSSVYRLLIVSNSGPHSQNGEESRYQDQLGAQYRLRK